MAKYEKRAADILNRARRGELTGVDQVREQYRQYREEIGKTRHAVADLAEAEALDVKRASGKIWREAAQDLRKWAADTAKEYEGSVEARRNADTEWYEHTLKLNEERARLDLDLSQTAFRQMEEIELAREGRVRDARLRGLEAFDAQTLEQKAAVERRKAEIEIEHLERVHQIRQRLFDLDTSQQALDLKLELKRLGYQASEIEQRIAEYTLRREQARQSAEDATDDAVEAARQSAANRTAGLIRDHNRQVFESFKRQAQGVFDVATDEIAVGVVGHRQFTEDGAADGDQGGRDVARGGDADAVVHWAAGRVRGIGRRRLAGRRFGRHDSGVRCRRRGSGRDASVLAVRCGGARVVQAVLVSVGTPDGSRWLRATRAGSRGYGNSGYGPKGGDLGGEVAGSYRGVGGAKGGAMLPGGSMLAVDGLRRGGGTGAAETTAGGALIGWKFGGPLGAAIGASVGFMAGVVRLFVKGAVEKAREKIKAIYGVDVSDKGVLTQIVQTAKQAFGGNLEMAIRSPQVRELIELYAMSTGQKPRGMPGPPRCSRWRSRAGRCSRRRATRTVRLNRRSVGCRRWTGSAAVWRRMLGPW